MVFSEIYSLFSKFSVFYDFQIFSEQKKRTKHVVLIFLEQKTKFDNYNQTDSKSVTVFENCYFFFFVKQGEQEHFFFCLVFKNKN